MRTIHIAPDAESIYLGRQGENEAQQVIFDTTSYPTIYGTGAAQVLVQRHGDAAAYVAADVTQTEDAVTWIIDSTDTAVPGFGSAQLVWLADGDVVAKSPKYKTKVDEALTAP